MAIKQCYYCQGSLNYTFCSKAKELNLELSEEVCNIIVSEITMIEQQLEDLKKEVEELKFIGTDEDT